MSDLLRPLIGFVESVARANRAAGPVSSDANSGLSPTSKATQIASPGISFKRKLRDKLIDSAGLDSQQRRRVFIELALTNELGEQLNIDPGFNLLIEKVNSTLSLDRDRCDQLDQLLANVSGIADDGK